MNPWNMPTELIKYCEIWENNIKGMTVPIHKPAGWTSFDVVKKLRNVTGFKKVGHGGTLDPFASGLLMVGFGTHTKKLNTFLKADKSYEVLIRTGVESDTMDITGTIHLAQKSVHLNRDILLQILQSFKGPQQQIPPMYSAKKVDGTPLYKRARKGEVVKRKPLDIEIYETELLDFTEDTFRIRVSCSSGTYIRVLAHDLGKALGTAALAEELIRLGIGDITLEKSLTIEDFIEQWKLLAA
ncbi:TPA: tRNA pseudouridine(55) synthase TruB [Candidatus Marinimicrobia bacterium]|nr:tRNA pseudouridine(55) synthase TruB [Candidatus Neomarinimicrobiota bacterium]HBY17954.1 tRNA pseudouridine(55) synthase TruB [Candidatus Neomarinimicrobiota bacterium]